MKKVKKTFASKLARELKRLLYQTIVALCKRQPDVDFDRDKALQFLESHISMQKKSEDCTFLFELKVISFHGYFFDFIQKNEKKFVQQCVTTLIQGMDELSQAIVKRVMLQYQALGSICRLNLDSKDNCATALEEEKNHAYWQDYIFFPMTLSPVEIDFIKEIDEKKHHGKFPKYDLLEYGHISLDALATEANMDFIPREHWKIEGRDVLDCGGFIGDTALIYSDLNPQSVHVFEPSHNNRSLLEKVISRNGKSQRIIPVPLATSDKQETVRFYTTEGIDAGASVVIGETTSPQNSYEVKCITIDEYVEKNSLNVGLIKMDVEGAEYASIQGALKTIKKFRPNLIISIYHTPKDFFEIKPLLDSLNLGYVFLIRQLPPYMRVLSEMELIAYCEH